MYTRQFIAACIVFVASATTPLSHAAAPRKKVSAEPILGESLDGRFGARIDVVFVIDATGSMRPKAEFVKAGILEIARGIMKSAPPPDIRFGIVIYRDRGEAFVTRTFPLSRDFVAFRDSLRVLWPTAGGEDPHEDVAAALAAAIYGMNWDTDRNTERRIYLVGDAPPHPEYTDAPDVSLLAAAAHDRGMVVNTVACSLWGELIDSWRTIAAISGGGFSFLVPGEIVFGPDEVMTAFGYGPDLFVAKGEVAISSWSDLANLAETAKLVKVAPGDIREYLRKDGDALDRYLVHRLSSAAASP